MRTNSELVAERAKIDWSKICAVCGMPRAFHDARLKWSRRFEHNPSGMSVVQMLRNDDGTMTVEFCLGFEESVDIEKGGP